MNQFLDLLERLSRRDFRLDLGPMREGAARLGNPQDTYASVHIVGTNGKGSTAAFLSSLLQAAGYKTGLITSPHLIDVRERIQIDRQCISWEALTELVEKIQPTLPDPEFLSYFEMITLIGFEYFAKMGVAIAVVEAGMGGRFDATNILKPQVAIFTPISLDHEIYLGDSIAKIAEEKCGILKPEMTVISAPQVEDAAIVIEDCCEKLELELTWADPNKIECPLGLAGAHQKTNAACALLAAQAMVTQDVIDAVSTKALAETKWPGRLEYLGEAPKILVDGAHNSAGIQTLADYLKEFHSHQDIHCIVGVLKDKNFKEMFAPLAPLVERFICVEPKTERALPAQELAEALKVFGKPVEVIEEPLTQALTPILETVKPQDLAVVTGSLYVVGEVYSWFVNRES